MKPILHVLFALLIFSSCTHYNYYFLSGKNLSNTEPQNLTSENDTLRVEYDFATNRGKIGIKITNKTDEFIEVDWKKSAVLVGGKAYGFYNPEALLTGTISRDSLPSRSFLAATGDADYRASVSANIIISEPEEFLFPRSYIQKRRMPQL